MILLGWFLIAGSVQSLALTQFALSFFLLGLGCWALATGAKRKLDK